MVNRLLLYDLLSIFSYLLIFLLFALLLLLFLLPLQELIGGLVGSIEIDMQDDEIHQQKIKHQQHQSYDPSHYNPCQLRTITKVHLKTPNPHMYHHNQRKAKCRNDANKEIPIIPLSNTVIEPYTVMIEPIDTSITHPAMLAIGPTVTITILTK
jgi:hypothetical protein